ncbi:MAG TPA: NADH-quinone oxidoreductase subunit NuoG, partial [Actinomycetota bacterium]|nr:NADH-quinone oxidoreductase subunit NuoG [Actinomycetota bacterium]
MSAEGSSGAPEKVNLTLNGEEIQAEKGRLLIDVAEERGVFVPRFCYHPGMKSVAVCRMCLVKVEGAPKLLPACATPVDDGMKVDTVDADAIDAQEGMLEFLLINHPLDCPICDRAGECPLQDQTFRHGPGSSRYVEEKRHFEKALEISDLVVLDRERCVLCWRCVRFADEIAGDRFIQLIDRGAGTQILTFSDEPFDSYFSGNTVQICPVGALTAKPYRFVSRPWDLETAPSVCAYCSVGCPITSEAREGRMVRCQALPNERVNDFWNCDKGRFGFHYISSEERLTNPLVRDGDRFETSAWGRAMEVVAKGLKDAQNVGVIAGAHLTTEDAHAIAKLARDVIGTGDIDSRIQDAGAAYEASLPATGIAGSTARIDDLDSAKTIVWVGPDPKEALPVLYLRVRRAVIDGGAKLVVVGPRRISLDSFATKVVRTDTEAEALSALGTDSDLEDPFVVAWGPASPGRDEGSIASAAAALAAGRGKLLVCPPHAGSQGMIDMGVHPGLKAGNTPANDTGRDTRAILEAAAAGELDALLIFGADPISDFPDAELARRALSADAFTIVAELFATESAAYADVLLPSAAYAEREGTFTNLERRLQKLEPLLPPPGTAREPWRIASAIAAALGEKWDWHSCNDIWDDIRATVPTHADVDTAALHQEMPVQTLQYESGLGTTSSELPGVLAGPGGQYPKGYRSGAPFQTGQNWPLSWELRAFEARQRPGFVPDIPSDSERPAGGDADLPSLSTPTPSIARAGTASPSSAGGDF